MDPRDHPGDRWQYHGVGVLTQTFTRWVIDTFPRPAEEAGRHSTTARNRLLVNLQDASAWASTPQSPFVGRARWNVRTRTRRRKRESSSEWYRKQCHVPRAEEVCEALVFVERTCVAGSASKAPLPTCTADDGLDAMFSGRVGR